MYPAGITDTGRCRANNEDSLFVCGDKFHALPNLFIVADGMGGHNAGEVASLEAVSFFKEFCQKTPLKKNGILNYLTAGCAYANEKVLDMAEADDSLFGMGTTFTVCVKNKKKLYIAHIGDSRVYAAYEDRLEQLTDDHTYVYEMRRLGQITELEARTHPRRNMLTKVLGVERGIAFDASVFELTDCLKILMCSDGLTNMLDDDAIFKQMRGDNEVVARRLVESANENGGTDNITLIVFDATGTGGDRGAA